MLDVCERERESEIWKEEKLRDKESTLRLRKRKEERERERESQTLLLMTDVNTICVK